MKTINAALVEMRDSFKSAGLDTPELDARLLIQNVLEISPERLLLDFNKLVTDSESKRLINAMQRRLLREPVSRIIGSRSFWKSEFKITPKTLDPRPDSETLIESVLSIANKEAPLTILDMGTGSGCLLLSLLQELPQATGIGIDISAEAVQIAIQNAKTLNLSKRVLFKVMNWTEMTNESTFDLVISNPPYISESDISTLEPEVRQHDPILALSGGTDGLDCYREIAILLPCLLTETGYAFLEIGATQAKTVKDILAKQSVRVLRVTQDLAGHNRCVVAHLV
ncbi:MAG: peptide chain release factor N(5)-glutamine methyltransferase [Alphaproteobacteria bacterium]|nr:peptide chain release factor N(5)-glutamine methyltransferase [Alphaproteobacteria bacterium]